MNDAPPGRSHNRASLRDLLAERDAEVEAMLAAEGADLVDRCELLMRAFARVPEEVDSAELAADVADQAGQFGAVVKLAEARRRADKAPVLRIGRRIDAWYGRLAQEAEAAKDALEARLNLWQTAAEEERVRGERGAIASIHRHWTCDRLVQSEVDLEALRHCFTDDALYAAVREYIRRGGRELKGVRIFQTAKTQVRT